MILTVTPACLLFAKPQGRGVRRLRSELPSAATANESPGPTATCEELTAVCRASVDLLQKAVQRHTRDNNDHK